MKVMPLDYENSKIFSNVVPEYVRCLLKLPWVGALGAIIEDEDLIDPVGTIFYREGEDGEFFISWLYVDESNRNRGIGENLLAETCILAGKKGFSGISVLFSETVANKECLENLESYFIEKGFTDKWKLPSNFIIDAETFCHLSLIKQAEKASLNGVKSFEKISLNEFNVFMDNKGIKDISASDFDQKVSCGIYHDGLLEGVYLVLKSENYYIPVALFSKSTSDQKKLILFSCLKTVDIITLKDLVVLLDLTRKESDIFEKLFSEQDTYKVYALGAAVEDLLKNIV